MPLDSILIKILYSLLTFPNIFLFILVARNNLNHKFHSRIHRLLSTSLQTSPRLNLNSPYLRFSQFSLLHYLFLLFFSLFLDHKRSLFNLLVYFLWILCGMRMEVFAGLGMLVLFFFALLKMLVFNYAGCDWF